jgi:hypothetical protein
VLGRAIEFDAPLQIVREHILTLRSKRRLAKAERMSTGSDSRTRGHGRANSSLFAPGSMWRLRPSQ